MSEKKITNINGVLDLFCFTQSVKANFSAYANCYVKISNSLEQLEWCRECEYTAVGF